MRSNPTGLLKLSDNIGVMPMSNTLKLVAAVDLGSNSFHLLIGRVVESSLGHQIYPLDSLKEVVRLAAGLGSDKRLDPASQTRAIHALQRFGERLRSFSPDRVRAVATNTLRVAKNGQDFLRTAEAARAARGVVQRLDHAEQHLHHRGSRRRRPDRRQPRAAGRPYRRPRGRRCHDPRSARLTA